MISRLFAALGLAATLLASPLAVQAASVNSGHVEIELVAQETSATPGGTVFVALRQKILKGWHTYWRNPGDSGEATAIAWTLPTGWKAGDIQWPTPERLPVGPLMNFGYENEVLLPVALQVPADAKGPVTLKADVTYLVCADICIPEDATVTLELPVAASGATPDPKWGAAIGKTLAALPTSGDLTAVFAAPAADGRVKLALTGAAAGGAKVSDVFFYPYDGAVIDHAAKQVVERGNEGLTLSIAPGFSFRQGPAPTALAGVVVIDGAAHEISAAAGAIPAGAAGLGPPPAKAAVAPPPTIGLGVALAFAFLGGLILNLMPCVFPVLSLKAAALARHAHEEPGAVRTQGLVFGLGVIVTFLALAAALLAARAAGQAVGWGFQLQSPQVVAGLALVILLVALNLSGVFEIGTSVQNTGSDLAAKGGLAGAFFTGVLAVVVAAPCTAPAMGAAIGFAVVQPPLIALSVFLFLGLGLAAPFVALSFAPGLLKLLPRPGAWMDTFKSILAFPMYAAAAWLMWTLTQQTNPIGLAQFLAAAVLIAFAAWLFGRVQARRAEGKTAWLSAALALIAFLGAIGLGAALAYPPPVVAAAAEGSTSTAEAGAELPSEPWSVARVQALQAEGRPVFVNFTAAWCVTCQVNDKVALSTKRAAEAFKAANAVYLVGDWTNRNAEIAAALAEQGRAGVPLYLVYPKGGGAPKVLPQLLTSGAVEKALKEAS